MHEYNINYHILCLCIEVHNFYCFIDWIEHCQEQHGKSACFLIEYNFRISQLMKYFWCTHIHTESLLLFFFLIQ